MTMRSTADVASSSPLAPTSQIVESSNSQPADAMNEPPVDLQVQAPIVDGGGVGGLRGVVRGTPVLLLRQAVTVVVTVLGAVVLARLLSPSDFGVYALILTVAGFLRLVTDGGLGAALIHQQKQPSRHEFHQIFTLQIVVVVALLAVIEPVIWLLPVDLFSAHDWKLALGLGTIGALATPFIANAAASLERDLRFTTLGFIGMVQPVAFNVAAVLLAVMLPSAWVLGLALLLSNALLALAGRKSRAPIGITWRWAGLRSKLSFGAPYVGAQVVSTLKDAVNPVFIGLVLGASAAGYVNWASQLAVMPTLLVVALSRYVFPVLARAHGDARQFERALQVGLFLFTTSVAPVASAIALFAIPITETVYGPRWLPAVSLVALLSVANVLAPATSILLAAVSAMGRPSIALKMTLVWCIGTWVLVPTGVSVLGLGMAGFAWANLLVGLSALPLFVIVGRVAKLRLIWTLILPWCASGIVVGGAWLSLHLIPILGAAPQVGQILVAVGSVLVAWVAIASLSRRQVGDIVRSVRSA